MGQSRIVLDTNAFVAAGFNRGSASARIVDRIRDGRLHMVWNEATRREIRHVIEVIPRLSWSRFEDVFREEDRYDGETAPGDFGFVLDPADRKFIALAHAAGAVVVTSDRHLLEHRERFPGLIRTPSEFMGACD